MKTAWPRCLTEAETLRYAQNGWSIARFGDGELKIARGAGNTTHQPNPALTAELCRILRSPATGLLPCIPPLNERDPSYVNWVSHAPSFVSVLDLNYTYGSAFIGRAKNAPWVATPEHANNFRAIWAGKKVVAVEPHDSLSLFNTLEKDAAAVSHVGCPRIEAYSEINNVEREVLRHRDVAVVVICAGPMATCLANRLAGHGLQAIDLGRGLGLVQKFAP